MGKERAPRRLADNEASAKAAALRVSPRKLNLLAETIRGKPVDVALSELEFSRRRIAADVRKVRPPEPYKGKGIRYLGEHVRRKAGKAAVGV